MLRIIEPPGVKKSPKKPEKARLLEAGLFAIPSSASVGMKKGTERLHSPLADVNESIVGTYTYLPVRGSLA